jgi:hypothetical protein
LAYLRTNKLSLLKSGVYTPESYLEEEDILNSQLIKLQQLESVSDESMYETMRDIIKLSELLKTVSLQYDFANSYEKETIIKLIFSELSISDNTLKYKCVEGLKPFENRFLLSCDPTGWLSEQSILKAQVKKSIALLEDYCKALV